MTPKDQQVAIAESCGWMSIQESGRLDGQLVGYPPNGLLKRQVIPDYLRDLNAMHNAEKTLKPHWLPVKSQGTDDTEWEMYICEVSKLCDSGPTHATATQRAEAFLKTINKWKE